MSLNLNNMHDQLMNNKNGASNVKGIFKEAYMNLDEHALQLSMFGKRQEASFQAQKLIYYDFDLFKRN